MAMDQALNRIRKRAYELFSGRGFGDGHALDDWLAAECEICRPVGEFVEQDRAYVLNLALPGFEPARVHCWVTPPRRRDHWDRHDAI